MILVNLWQICMGPVICLDRYSLPVSASTIFQFSRSYSKTNFKHV